MKLFIKGYQYGENNEFIGEYTFPNNLDKEEIHLPPNTTLTKPPKLSLNEIAVWDETKWSVTHYVEPVIVYESTFITPEIPVTVEFAPIPNPGLPEDTEKL